MRLSKVQLTAQKCIFTSFVIIFAVQVFKSNKNLCTKRHLMLKSNLFNEYFIMMKMITENGFNFIC